MSCWALQLVTSAPHPLLSGSSDKLQKSAVWMGVDDRGLQINRYSLFRRILCMCGLSQWKSHDRADQWEAHWWLLPLVRCLRKKKCFSLVRVVLWSYWQMRACCCLHFDGCSFWGCVLWCVVCTPPSLAEYWALLFSFLIFHKKVLDPCISLVKAPSTVHISTVRHTLLSQCH